VVKGEKIGVKNRLQSLNNTNMVAVRKKLTFIFFCLYKNRSSMPFKNALSIFYKLQISCLCLKNCGPSPSGLKEILRCLSYLYKKFLKTNIVCLWI
jgi:hypothetical protein